MRGLTNHGSNIDEGNKCNSSMELFKNNGQEYVGFNLLDEDLSVYYSLSGGFEDNPDQVLVQLNRNFDTLILDDRKLRVFVHVDNMNHTQYGELVAVVDDKVRLLSEFELEIGRGFTFGVTHSNFVNDGAPGDGAIAYQDFGISGDNQYVAPGANHFDRLPGHGAFLKYNNNFSENSNLDITFNDDGNGLVSYTRPMGNAELKLQAINYEYRGNGDNANVAQTYKSANATVHGQTMGDRANYSVGIASSEDRANDQVEYDIGFEVMDKVFGSNNIAYLAHISTFEKFNITQAHNSTDSTAGVTSFVKGTSFNLEALYQFSSFNVGLHILGVKDNRAAIANTSLDAGTHANPNVIRVGISLQTGPVSFAYEQMEDRDDDTVGNEALSIKLCNF